MSTDNIKELEFYKKLFGVGDVATRAYTSLVKVLEQQVDYLKEFDLKASIAKDKADQTYARATEIFESMPGIVLQIKKLKDELGIEYIEKEERIIPVTPQSIAKLQNGSHV